MADKSTWPVDVATLVGIPVVESESVPLERVNEDGTRTAALCWKIDGCIVVHPDRMPMFRAAIEKLGRRKS